MAGRKRNDLLSEIEGLKEALRACERRGQKAVRRARSLEAVLTKVVPRMKNWVSLPVKEETFARVITTSEVKALLAALDPDEGAPPPNEVTAC